MLESGKMTSNTDMAKWFGLIKAHMKVNFSKLKSKDKESTPGKTAESMKDNGKTI